MFTKKEKEKKEINVMGPFDWKGEKNKRIKNEKRDRQVRGEKKCSFLLY